MILLKPYRRRPWVEGQDADYDGVTVWIGDTRWRMPAWLFFLALLVFVPGLIGLSVIGIAIQIIERW